MVETPEQIESRIRDERWRLGQNLHELQGRVRDAANWRTYVNRKPLAVLGAAFGAGLLISRVTTRRSGFRGNGTNVHPSAYQTSHETGRGSEIWQNVRAALMGVTGAGAMRFLNDVIPGFREHYDRARYGRISPS